MYPWLREVESSLAPVTNATFPFRNAGRFRGSWRQIIRYQNIENGGLYWDRGKGREGQGNKRREGGRAGPSPLTFEARPSHTIRLSKWTCHVVHSYWQRS